MRSRDLFLFFFRLHLLPNFLYYKHQEVNMITNFKTTSISEELAIMNMADVDFTMWGEPAELAKDEYYLETFNHRREMEAKGYVLNPHFDENMAWWKDKHSTRPCVPERRTMISEASVEPAPEKVGQLGLYGIGCGDLSDFALHGSIVFCWHWRITYGLQAIRSNYHELSRQTVWI